LTLSEAKMRVERAFALKQRTTAAGPMVVVDESTIQKPYGYVFFVNKQRYLETGDLRQAAIGAGPVVLDRERKQIVMLPTYLEAAVAIAEYEAGTVVGTLIERLGALGDRARRTEVTSSARCRLRSRREGHDLPAAEAATSAAST